MTKNQVEQLLIWYNLHKRSLPWRVTDGKNPDPYHVWVSEVMLQQTRVESAKGYFIRFLLAFPTVEDLAKSGDDALLKCWEGLGYYSRARNLRRSAQILVEKYNGCLPQELEQLLKLPGIGNYTAGAVASIAFGMPIPAVDGNVLRVWTRLMADDSDITLEATKRKIFEKISQIIPKVSPGEFNQALMELGACVCVPNGAPLCHLCPWKDSCEAFRQESIQFFPVKSPKKPRRVEQRQLYLLTYLDKIALQKRPERGLLAGLWEFPEKFDIPERLILAREDAGQAIHRFTHVEWHMTAEKITLNAPMEFPEFTWVTSKELEKIYPLPRAFQAFSRQ